MTEHWYCLYVPLPDSQAVAGALRDVLTAAGYQAFDPFPGGTGTPPRLRDTVRQFVTPAADGWVRVVGEPDVSVFPALSERLGVNLLLGWLDAGDGGFARIKAAGREDAPDSLQDFLAPGRTPDDLRRALAGQVRVAPVESDSPPVAVVDANAIPDDIRELAQNRDVDPRRAEKMFEKISGGLFGRLSKGDRDASPDEIAQARALVSGGGQDHWNTLAGQRVRAAAEALALPDNWRLPDWAAVRDAYQVHRLRQRAPRMALMPGDRESMAKVPDALDYEPVYMGR